MSRRARTRPDKRRPPRLDMMAAVTARVQFLPHDQLAAQERILRTACAEFIKGHHCAIHWRSLADCSNLAETLCQMGDGGGPDVARVIEDAQRALHDVMIRHRTRGSWTLYADEIGALILLIDVHMVQLTHCTYGDFSDAMDSTIRRVAQAAAGNAPAGAIVITGEMGASHAG